MNRFFLLAILAFGILNAFGQSIKIEKIEFPHYVESELKIICENDTSVIQLLTTTIGDDSIKYRTSCFDNLKHTHGYRNERLCVIYSYKVESTYSIMFFKNGCFPAFAVYENDLLGYFISIEKGESNSSKILRFVYEGGNRFELIPVLNDTIYLKLQKVNFLNMSFDDVISFVKSLEYDAESKRTAEDFADDFIKW